MVLVSGMLQLFYFERQREHAMCRILSLGRGISAVFRTMQRMREFSLWHLTTGRGFRCRGQSVYRWFKGSNIRRHSSYHGMLVSLFKLPAVTLGLQLLSERGKKSSVRRAHAVWSQEKHQLSSGSAYFFTTHGPNEQGLVVCSRQRVCRQCRVAVRRSTKVLASCGCHSATFPLSNQRWSPHER
jgi:hypothetical protein